MSKFWSSIVKDLQPYTPGEQPKLTNLIKLNTNENPYPPSPRVQAALVAEDAALLRLYPDPNSDELRHALATYHDVEAAQVFVGNGSDEVLAHVFHALLKHEKPLLFPDISYSFYPVYCGMYQIDYRTVALDANFSIELDDYAHSNGGIIFPNPNAPTGKLLELSRIENLLHAHPDSVIVVDEAYIDFGGDSAIPLVKHFPNLLVVQTFSKSRSLAGLRVGFAIGDRCLIDALERIKNSFNSYPLDRLAQQCAVAALADRDYFDETCRRIMRSREWLSAQLTQLRFEVLPSQANFIFVRHAECDATSIAKFLRERAIVVRHFHTARIDNFLRITIGTDADCHELICALSELLGKSG